MYHFCFNVILFGLTVHANFGFNWCSVFTESYFYHWKRFDWSKSLLLRFPLPVKKILPNKISNSPHFLPLFGKPQPPPYLDFSGIAEEDWRHFLKRIGDILIKLHDAISEFGFTSGKPDSNWNKLFSKITRCTWWKLVDLQIIVMGWAYISYQIRRYTQKEFIVPHIFLAIGNKE